MKFLTRQDLSCGLTAGSASPAECSCTRQRHESVGSAFSWHVSKVGEFVGVGLKVLEEAFKFALHPFHLLAHVENNFDTGEVYAQVARQLGNALRRWRARG